MEEVTIIEPDDNVNLSLTFRSISRDSATEIILAAMDIARNKHEFFSIEVDKPYDV